MPCTEANMANQPWLDEVRTRLAGQALPPTYIKRFMEELSDHFQDLTEDTMSAESSVLSRLGEPNEVAEAVVTAYRQRSVLGRHPTAAFLVFAVSPIVSMVVIFLFMVVCLRIVGVTAELLGLISNEGFSTQPPGPVALTATCYVFSFLTIIIPAVVASILYCKLAKRLGIGGIWMFASSSVLAVTAVLPCWEVKTKIISAAGHYGIQAGLWIPGLCGWMPPITVPQLIQLLVPLAVGWWFLRQTWDQSRAQLAV
jgi:uncharacterized membrane protein